MPAQAAASAAALREKRGRRMGCCADRGPAWAGTLLLREAPAPSLFLDRAWVSGERAQERWCSRVRAKEKRLKTEKKKRLASLRSPLPTKHLPLNSSTPHQALALSHFDPHGRRVNCAESALRPRDGGVQRGPKALYGGSLSNFSKERASGAKQAKGFPSAARSVASNSTRTAFAELSCARAHYKKKPNASIWQALVS